MVSTKAREGSTEGGRTAPAAILSWAAVLVGLAAVLYRPIILGPLAIAIAIGASARGERRWEVGLGVAITGTVIGLVLGLLVAQDISG